MKYEKKYKKYFLEQNPPSPPPHNLVTSKTDRKPVILVARESPCNNWQKTVYRGTEDESGKKFKKKHYFHMFLSPKLRYLDTEFLKKIYIIWLKVDPS